MPSNENQTKEKKRNTYSFSMKKTDSPIIKEFAEEQTNFSESVRYLILKFCRENGVQDISQMLNEIMYFPDTESQVLKKENHENITKKVVIEEPKIIEKLKTEKVEVSTSNSSSEVIKDDIKEIKEEDNDIPDCYS